jgi:polysaccharide export outer membrane protein
VVLNPARYAKLFSLNIISGVSTMPFPGSVLRLRIAAVASSIFLTCVLVTAAVGQNASSDTTAKDKNSVTTPAETLSAADIAAAKPTATEKEGDASLKLGAGDMVEFSVYNVPELSGKARVGDNGDLYLPLIDKVHVAGLTPEEAQSLIEKRLSDGGFVRNPHVTVIIDQSGAKGASVLGEVAKPGIYPVLGEQHLFDIISAAGGLTDKAGTSVMITHRDHPDKPVTLPLARNLSDSTISNIEVAPGDTIVVRKADIVYVVGDVARPTGLLIDRQSMTVLQAIALAGGTTRTSKMNGARIIHRGPDGFTETHIQLKKILQAKAPDVTMKNDDILFVPSSSVKAALQNDTSIAIQAASLGLVAIR